MKVRVATPTDQEAIRGVHLNAFPAEERKLVAELSIELLAEKVHPSIISLVAEEDNKILAHIAFSPCMHPQENPSKVYILAPLGVIPEHQRLGVGSALIKKGIEMLISKDMHTVLVYGDPNYYCRFGFNALTAEGFIPPYNLSYPHGWLGLRVKHGFSSEQQVKFSCVRSLQNPKLW